MSLAPAPLDRRVRADEALRAHGLTGEALINLSRKAAHDALAKTAASVGTVPMLPALVLELAQAPSRPSRQEPRVGSA